MAVMIRWDVRSPADTCDIVAEETPSSRPSAAKDVPRSRSWYLMYSRRFRLTPAINGMAGLRIKLVN